MSIQPLADPDLPEVFTDGRTTVVWSDAVKGLERVVKDGTANLIFADPPYNLGKQFASFLDSWASEEEYVAWCKEWLAVCVRKLAPDGSFYLMASTQAMPTLDLFIRNELTVLSRIVWAYDSSGVQARKYFGSLYEPILHCVRDPRSYTFNADAIMVEAPTGARRKLIDYRANPPRPYRSHKVPGNVWTIPRVRYRMPEYEEHPAQKPERLLERIILASSRPGDLVVDPFAGTFTTSAVAARLGRQSVGVELELEYVRVGLRRLALRDELHNVPLRSPHKRFRRATNHQ